VADQSPVNLPLDRESSEPGVREARPEARHPLTRLLATEGSPQPLADLRLDHEVGIGLEVGVAPIAQDQAFGLDHVGRPVVSAP
jgi:hypothetical protein